MPKSSKPKKAKPASKSISVGGNVSNSVFIEGDQNQVNVQVEQIKIAYGLFTIPQPVTDFTGREQELAQLKESFSRGVIITGVSGAGGIGKTELARKLAKDVADNYPDAQLSIDLQGASEKPVSSEDAMRRLLEPFHMGQKLPDDELQLKGLYQQIFGRNKALILLDNAANAAQVRPLIPSAPSAAIITSRQHFSLTEFGLHEPVRLDVLSPEKASELLLVASPKLNDSFNEEVNQLAKLCGHLPLALRVAASLLNDRSDWTANTLINRLQDDHTRLKRLKREGDYDVEATLNLSCELLSGDLKKYFRALGIFTAPFAKVSAKAVLEIENDDELDDVLGKLIGRSLLNYQKSEAIVEDLYSMHDLTRLYASQKLLEKNEYEEIFARHAAHFLQWASESDDLYLKGNENILWGLKQFRFIWIHLYSIYERLLIGQKAYPRPQFADSWLSVFPHNCMYMLGLNLSPQEQIDILQTTLDAARRLGDRQNEGLYLGLLGMAYRHLGHVRNSIEFYEQALVIMREIGNRSYEGTIIDNLGIAYSNLGDNHKAIEYYEKHLEILDEIGDRYIRGYALDNVGSAYRKLGNSHKGIEFHEQALTIYRETGNLEGEGGVLCNLGIAYSQLGDTSKSIEFYEKALVILSRIGHRAYERNTLSALGDSYSNLRETRKAIERYEQALVIDREIGNRVNEKSTLYDLNNAYLSLQDDRKAIEFLEQALVIDREISNRQGEGGTLCNLGNCYYSLGNFSKSIEFYEKALVVLHDTEARDFKGNTLLGLGSVYKELGEKEKARNYWNEALKIYRDIESQNVSTLEKLLADLDEEIN